MSQPVRATTVNSRPRRSYGRGVLRELRRAHLYILPVIWALFNLFCVYWIVVSSLKTNRELANPWGFPAEPQWNNYAKVWNVANLGQQLLNSIIVTFAVVLLVSLLCAPAAYVLSRMRFKGSNWLTWFFVAGAGVPLAMLLIPLFDLTTKLVEFLVARGAEIGMTIERGTFELPVLVVIYTVVSLPFTMFMLTGFFKTLPSEFAEAARMDGCSEFGVFTRVMLPLASPGLLTAAIFNFVAIWNEYMLALTFIQDADKMPLARGLYAVAGSMQYTGDWAGLFAAVVIVMVPSLLIYALLSERLIEGITAGALK